MRWHHDVSVALRAPILAALFALSGTPAAAAIAVVGAPPAIDTALKCMSERFTWGLAAGVAEAAVDRCGSWLMGPQSPAAAVPGRPALGVGQKDLQFRFRHLVAGHAGEVAPNPVAGDVTVYAGRYAAGVKRAGAFVVEHDPHRDVYIWQVEVPVGGPPATIQSKAEHVGTKFAPMWSYDPAELGGPAIINSVRATYRTDPPKSVPDRQIPDGKINKKREGRLPDGASGEKPTDYHIRVTLGDPYFTDMTLGFVIGEPGAFELGELGVMNQAFTGGEEYLVPMIFDIGGTLDLYMAVDLTQWLSFPTAFAPGDVFAFAGGVNPALAGIQVALSPFSFDPTFGWVSDSLWTGTGIVLGTVDGGNIPEPASLPLLLAGFVATVWFWRRRQRR